MKQYPQPQSLQQSRHQFPPRLPGLIALGASALLMACGGGSSESSDSRRLQAVSADPAASAVADAAASGGAAATTLAAAASAATQGAVGASAAALAPTAAGPATKLKIASVQPGTSTTATGLPSGSGTAGGSAGGIQATGGLAPTLIDATAPSTQATAGATSFPTTTLTTSKILAGVDITRSLSSYNWIWSLECAGKVLGATAVPDGGLYAATPGSSNETLRFGKVSDPVTPTRQVLMFKAHRDDSRLSGAPRCEMTFSPTQAGRLPVGRDFWFGFGLLLPNWKSSADEQIVAQWHQANGTVALNPFFAISVQGNALRFQARQDGSATVSKASVVQPIDFQSPGLPVGTWTYLVVHARISSDPTDQPFLQVWRDGVQLFNYQGPLGYNISSTAPFAKIGHYHWIDASNPWPATTPWRTVMFRAPSFVLDEAGAYGPDDLRGYVMKN